MDALKFITCGSVDDGKSTLIGRLLVDSRAVLQDQLASVTRAGAQGNAQVDLAALTDGLSAEREQGITIDVAWRYFSTPARKFIIGDSPGHEQYTRNMVTAASSADAAVVLVDATKLDWRDPALKLMPQTRRHSLLVHLLRVPSIVVAINKLDAVEDPAVAFAHIGAALQAFAAEAHIPLKAVVPISALQGHNVVAAEPGWAGYQGPSLLQLLEELPNTQAETTLPFSFAVQWVEKFASSADTSQGRRVFWGKVASGGVQPGQTVRVLQGQGVGQTAVVAQVLDHTRQPRAVLAGHSAGIVLDRELDVSRGDWLLAVTAEVTEDDGFGEPAPTAIPTTKELTATLAWLDNEPLVPGRVYWALHGHRWVKAKVRRIVHQIHIETLDKTEAGQLPPNAIGVVELLLQEPIAALPYTQSRQLGALVLVDTASHATAGALMLL